MKTETIPEDGLGMQTTKRGEKINDFQVSIERWEWKAGEKNPCENPIKLTFHFVSVWTSFKLLSDKFQLSAELITRLFLAQITRPSALWPLNKSLTID